MQVVWSADEHQEAPAPFADTVAQNLLASQPAASEDLFIARSGSMSAMKSPGQSPPGDAAVSSQPRRDVLSPFMANSLLPAEHAHSSLRRLPAIQEAEVEGAPQDHANTHTCADVVADGQPHHLQATAGRPGAARELVWSQPHGDKGADGCCPPGGPMAAAPNSPAPARNGRAAGTTTKEGGAAKGKDAARKGRGRGAGRAACQSPPPKARRKAAAKVRVQILLPSASLQTLERLLQRLM